MSGSTYPASSDTAMRFVGRTFARLRHIQRRSKQSVQAVQLNIKYNTVSIDIDGLSLVKVVKNDYYLWDIEITQKLNNLLALEAVAVL